MVHVVYMNIYLSVQLNCVALLSMAAKLFKRPKVDINVWRWQQRCDIQYATWGMRHAEFSIHHSPWGLPHLFVCCKRNLVLLVWISQCIFMFHLLIFFYFSFKKLFKFPKGNSAVKMLHVCPLYENFCDFTFRCFYKFCKNQNRNFEALIT